MHAHGNLATRHSPEDTYLGILIGALGQIDARTIRVFDRCRDNATLDHTDRPIGDLMGSVIRTCPASAL